MISPHSPSIFIIFADENLCSHMMALGEFLNQEIFCNRDVGWLVKCEELFLMRF